MNFIPKEIKDSLDFFKKSFKKLIFTTTLTSDINFSRILESSLECDCINEFCIKNCPKIPKAEINIETPIHLSHMQDFILSIKSLNILCNIKNALFCLTIYLEKEDKNIILFKGLINNFIIDKLNYSFPLKMHLPNKIIFKIFIINENGNKLFNESNKILNMGVIDFGLTFL